MLPQESACVKMLRTMGKGNEKDSQKQAGKNASLDWGDRDGLSEDV